MSSGLHGHGAGESQSGAPVQGAGVLDDGPPSASRSGGQGGGAGENGDGSRRPPILLRGGRRGSSPTRMGSSERAGATQGGLHAAQGGAGGHTPMPPGPPVRRPSSGKRDSLREDDVGAPPSLPPLHAVLPHLATCPACPTMISNVNSRGHNHKMGPRTCATPWITDE